MKSNGVTIPCSPARPQVAPGVQDDRGRHDTGRLGAQGTGSQRGRPPPQAGPAADLLVFRYLDNNIFRYYPFGSVKGEMIEFIYVIQNIIALLNEDPDLSLPV